MRMCAWLTLLLLASCHAPGPAGDSAPDAGTRGVAYLLRQQQADGSFVTGIDRSFMKDYFHLGVNTFCAMALMTSDGNHHDAIVRSVKFTLANMTPEGYVVRGETNKRAPYFEHAMGMLLLGEYLIRYPDRDPAFVATVRERLTKGVEWTINAQRAEGGWPYRDGHRILEAIGAALQLDALRSARDAGIRVPPELFAKGIALIKGQAEASGAFRCKTVDREGHTTYAGSTYPIAILNALGESASAEAVNGVKYLRESKGGVEGHTKWLPEDAEKPAWFKGGLQLEGIFYALLAFRRCAKEEWQAAWFGKIREHLIAAQAADGSWPGLYGSAYGTAVALLMLNLETPDVHWFNGDKPWNR